MTTESIAIEDIATVFLTEFFKVHKDHYIYTIRDVFMKCNYKRRRKMVEQVINTMDFENIKS